MNCFDVDAITYKIRYAFMQSQILREDKMKDGQRVRFHSPMEATEKDLRKGDKFSFHGFSGNSRNHPERAHLFFKVEAGKVYFQRCDKESGNLRYAPDDTVYIFSRSTKSVVPLIVGMEYPAPFVKDVDSENAAANHCTKCDQPLAKGSSDFCGEHRKAWYTKISGDPEVDVMDPDRDIVEESRTDPSLLPLRSDEDIVEEEVRSPMDGGKRIFSISNSLLIDLLRKNVEGFPQNNLFIDGDAVELWVRSSEFCGINIDNPIKIDMDPIDGLLKIEGMAINEPPFDWRKKGKGCVGCGKESKDALCEKCEDSL